MAPARIPESREAKQPKNARAPQSSQNRAVEAEPPVDPTSQSPDDPIEFAADGEVARGNEERANAEPEPAALHDAQVPGKPDMAQRRREIAKDHDQD